MWGGDKSLGAYYRAGDHGCPNVRRAIAAEFADAPLAVGGVGDGGFVLRGGPAPAYAGDEAKLRKLRTDAGRVPRQALMHLADFCPCPEGDSPSAKRSYDALLAGCVPVVVSDDALWAFSNEQGLDGLLDPANFALNVSEQAMLAFDADPPKPTAVNTAPDSERSHHAGRGDGAGGPLTAFPLLATLQGARPRLPALRRAGDVAAWAYRYYAAKDYGDEDPLLAGAFPDGGALALLVRDLERRARGARWPACEAELAEPHFDLRRQYCGAVPVAKEARDLKDKLKKTKDPTKRAKLQAAVDAYEGGRVFRRR